MDFLQAYSDDEDEDTDGHQLASETIPSSVTIYPSNQLTSVTTSVIADVRSYVYALQIQC